jgi:hypothetical protein
MIRQTLHENDVGEYQKYVDKGHRLAVDGDGEVRYECSVEPHGGPYCVLCEESWCQHCVNVGRETIKECDAPEQLEITQ